MLKIIHLEPGIAVAPQLAEPDFAKIAACGFRTVVDSRPDGEAPDQLAHARAEAVACRHGLAFRYQPVMSVNVMDEDVVDAFARLMDDLPRPILFYCATGMRCVILWAQAAALRLGIDEVLGVAHGSGYNLDFLRDTLKERQVTPAQSRSLVGAVGATCSLTRNADYASHEARARNPG